MCARRHKNLARLLLTISQSNAPSRRARGSARFSGAKRDPLALFNSAEWRRAEFGGSSGHANARGLGRIMTVLANGGISRGVRLLSPKTIDMIFREQFSGIDSYYMKPIRWGIGYALASEDSNARGPLPFLRPSRAHASGTAPAARSRSPTSSAASPFRTS